MTLIDRPFCYDCKYFDKASQLPTGTCRAFPDGIPVNIFSSSRKHRKPRKGQIGSYVYTPREAPLGQYKRLCETCSNYQGGRKCRAFIEEIPAKYWKQEFGEEPKHNVPDKGQFLEDAVYRANPEYLGIIIY